jgi:hypothetical protein
MQHWSPSLPGWTSRMRWSGRKGGSDLDLDLCTKRWLEREGSVREVWCKRVTPSSFDSNPSQWRTDWP